MARTFFLMQAKHSKAGTWDKGIVIKEGKTDADNYADALQAYHAYLGAYAYGHDASTDYVCAYIYDENGNRAQGEVWDRRYKTDDGGEEA